MSVIPLTVSLSLGLVFIFVALFWREQRGRHRASPERDSLLPLAEEQPRAAGHAPAAAGCGCARGEHSPCAGCRRDRPAAATPL